MTDAAPNVFLEFGRRYRHDSRLFVREVLGASPQPWQDEVLAAYDRGDRRISIRSGHGVGKSTVLAWIMVHHLVCYLPQKTVCTAPTSNQLYDALWAEFKSWLTRLPAAVKALLEVKAERVELRGAPSECFTSARTSRAEQPEALQGIHSPHVLLIADEASGIPEQVFEAAAGSMSGDAATTILAGNPVRGQGFFFNTHNKLKSLWTHFRVSCLDSPFVTKDFVDQIRLTYGENSNAYRVRVLGEFPVADDDTVIPFDLVEAATTRDIVSSEFSRVVWGLDCARFGGDRSALAKRRPNELIEPVRFWRQLDTMQLAGRVKQEYDTTPDADRPALIAVDAIGIGAGVVDRLRVLGLPVRGVNVSESPALGEKYRNLRAELWFKAREWFNRRDCKIPKQDELIAELIGPRYRFAAGSGKVTIESKDEMKKRGLDSPDLADAFVLTFADNAVGALYGKRAWNAPWRRKIKGIV